MKFSVAIILLSLASLAVADEYFVEAARYLESCYNRIGLTDGVGPLDVKQSKCGICCMFVAFKLMNEDGSFNLDEIQKHSKTITAEKLNEYTETCENEGGFNKHSKDYACEIAACFFKNDFLSDFN